MRPGQSRPTGTPPASGAGTPAPTRPGAAPQTGGLGGMLGRFGFGGAGRQAPTAPAQQTRPAETHVVQRPGDVPTGTPIAGRRDAAMDGHLMTTQNGGTSYGPGVSAGSIPGANGRPTTMYVNGVDNTAANHQQSLRAIENATGDRAVGLYNATQRRLGTPEPDFAQTFADRGENTRRANGTWTGQSANPATRSLSDSIVNHLNNQQDPLHLMAHSQGAVITANALYDARQRLVGQHGEQRANDMMRRVNVETFGGAARNFVNGPNYTHWINTNDRVTIARGLGTTPATGGQGAQFRNFARPNGLLDTGHGFEAVYLPERQRQLAAQRN